MFHNLKTPDDLLRVIKDERIKIIALRFIDLTGRWQKVEVASTVFDLERLRKGVGFPSSSANGRMQEGEMLLIPDLASAFVDPFSDLRTLTMICNIHDPVSGKPHDHDPRSIAQKAEAYLLHTQIGETARFGIELEHFVLDGAPVKRSNSPDTKKSGQKAKRPSSSQPLVKLFSNQVCSPDRREVLQELSTHIVATLVKIGIKIKAENDEVASSVRSKIYIAPTTLARMADNVMIYKYVLENSAREGVTATFFPPFSNGQSAMTVYQSLWLGHRPLFVGDGYAGSAALMRHYIAGLVEHTPALLAICASTSQSERSISSLKPPVNLHYTPKNEAGRSRTPMNLYEPNAKCAEFRCPDPSINPYLTFAAVLMAGIDGFENRLYDVDRDESLENYRPSRELPSGSFKELLKSLEVDHAFMLRGDVFTPEAIQAFLKLQNHRQATEKSI